MKRSDLERANRKTLVRWLEDERSVMCRAEESTELLRECALEDYDSCAKEEGFHE